MKGSDTRIVLVNDPDIKITTGKIWYSPVAINTFVLNRLASKDSVSNKLKQQIEDLRFANIVAPVLYSYNGMPAFIQLFDPDPPDAVILQYPKKYEGQTYITQLEITSYLDYSESLLDALIRTKIPLGFEKPFSKNYILAVVVEKTMNVDHELKPLQEHVSNRKLEFPIWIIRDVSAGGDTIAEITFIDDKIQRAKFNIGEIAQDYKTYDFPYIIERRRAGSMKHVRIEGLEKEFPPPWEIVGIK